LISQRLWRATLPSLFCADLFLKKGCSQNEAAFFIVYRQSPGDQSPVLKLEDTESLSKIQQQVAAFFAQIQG
jgi:hypothetical protein